MLNRRNPPTTSQIEHDKLIRAFFRHDPDLDIFCEELDKEQVQYTIHTMQKKDLSLIPLEVAEKILRCKKIARSLDCSIGIVGGFVRDLLLSNPTRDVDFILFKGNIELLTTTIANHLNGKIGKMSNKTLTTQVRFNDGVVFEFNATRKEHYSYPSRVPIVEKGSVKDDLFRRDFTINAFVMFGNKYIDVFDGLADLRNMLIKTTRDPEVVFKEDYLRLFRALRFACTLNFTIADEVKKGIIKNVENLLDVPNERILNELKLAISANPVKCFQLMRDLKILETLFPEILNLKLDNKVYNVHSVWEKIEKKLSLLQKAQKQKRLDPLLFLSVLLHEIVENPLETKRIKKHHTSFPMLKEKLKRLRFSKKEIQTIVQYINATNQIILFSQSNPSKFEIRVLLRNVHQDLDNIILLALVEAETRTNINVDSIIDQIKKISKDKELYAFKLAITGHDIEEIFGIKGKLIGYIKGELEAAVMNEKITNTKEECINFIEKHKSIWLQQIKENEEKLGRNAKKK